MLPLVSYETRWQRLHKLTRLSVYTVTESFRFCIRSIMKSPYVVRERVDGCNDRRGFKLSLNCSATRELFMTERVQENLSEYYESACGQAEGVGGG